ncbi:hypothetical protein MKCMC460_62790 (plasmid) [Mycobacterium sp. 20KCMC460]|nr:hypothetical protein MKCMC460_62790 [Mycobacterium sp. 20KCMC460]GLD21673.1 hypothetical protein Mkiyose1385_57720 [Mycobacterium kiyosense]
MARTGRRTRVLRDAKCSTVEPAIALDLGALVWAGVPCWSGRAARWATFTVPVAYDCRYDSQVRVLMPGNPVSRQALLAVAEARAGFADYGTGRNCRPTNERLAAVTGLSVRTVQRADTALRLLGVATEVLRGRQRTRIERLASWRVGDRGRGWASVWALHDHPFLNTKLGVLSPHPEGSSFQYRSFRKERVTTESRRRTGAATRGATRRASLDKASVGLAVRWRADTRSPGWARRYSPAAWARVLAGPAQHGWVARDVNQLVSDWIGVHGWLPDAPYRPIGLVGAMLAWHGDLSVRPAAADMAREAQELAAARARVADQLADRARAAAARAVGVAALGGPGHHAALAAAAAATRRAAARRTQLVATDTARREALIRAARGLKDSTYG